MSEQPTEQRDWEDAPPSTSGEGADDYKIQLPVFGPILTLSRVPRSWAAGVTDLGAGRMLVVSRGVGMERGRAPRVRFLCRPEVVVVDLVPEPGLRAHR